VNIADRDTDDVKSPVRIILADRNFRRFWISQVLYSAVNGSLRFTFVWLVVTLTDWRAAEGLVAITLGLPAMFLSVPAGAWSDRVNRRQLFVRWTTATCIALAIFTVLIATGVTAIAALIIGIGVSINMPNVGAIVPLLVPKERLMNAIALQNGGGQAAGFVGLAGGGVAIAVFGDAGGFGLFTVVLTGSLILMSRVDIPADAASAVAEQSMFASIKEGAHFALSKDPLRTLIFLAMTLGSSFSVMQISMPRVVEETYGNGAGVAGLVLGSFGMGMLVSSAAVANRVTMRHGRNVALFIGIGLGMGQFLLSWAPNA
jgi:MFS family permease